MPDLYQLDQALLDTQLLDGVSSSPTPPSDDTWYNYYGLNNSTVNLVDLVISAPDYELTERAFPRADGAYAETAYYRRTTIKIKGVIRTTSRTLLETEMDAMKKALGIDNGTLKLTWKGVTRYYDNCYPVGINTIFDGREAFHVSFVPFEMTFVSLQPYGRDDNRTVLDSPYPITASPTSFIANNLGSAVSDALIFLNLNTVGTASQIVILNTANGDQITIAGSFSNGDLLTIDGEQKTVQKNGVAIDYTGVIPRLKPGNNTLQVTVTGSGYSISFTEQHYSRYL